MASNFPTTLDNAATIPVESTSTPLSTNHVTAHQNIQDAIEAIEAKVGVDGSAVNTSLDYKLSGVATGDKAVSKTGTETLTNKTLTSPTITSPSITVGSDATGDIYYRSAGGAFTRLAVATNGYILKLVAGLPSWAAESIISNASTSAAGIVEEATQAEVDAGTAAGGTGARLFVNPSTLSVNGSKAIYTATESISAGDAVAAYYVQSDGGIVFDNKTTNNTTMASGGGTVTISFTVGSGSNRMLTCFVNVGASTGTVPTPTATYNGSAMTARDTQASASSDKLFSFTLASPSTGTNNLVLTFPASGQLNYVSTAIMSYSGVSGVATAVGDTTYQVTYGTPGLGHLIVSAATLSGSASGNNNSNFQDSGANTFARIYSGDSGVAFTSSSAVVSYFSGSSCVTTIGLTCATAPTYGVVCKASAATPANGVNLNKYSTFIGIASTTASAASPVKVIVAGEATGLTGLSAPNLVYLSNTAGALSSSAGSNSKKVGIATSTTTLVLKDSI